MIIIQHIPYIPFIILHELMIKIQHIPYFIIQHINDYNTTHPLPLMIIIQHIPYFIIGHELMINNTL